MNAPEYPMPQVTFDVRLGECYEFVDFDYEAYASQQADQGVNDEAVENLSINFKPVHALRKAKGVYHPKTSDMEIGVPSRDEDRKTNRRLAHETRHFQDFQLGKIGSIDMKWH